jgi:hypothetical protein
VRIVRVVSFVRLLKKPRGFPRDVGDGPSGAEGVRLAWELSQEQWAFGKGGDDANQGMQKSAVKLTRRPRA